MTPDEQIRNMTSHVETLQLEMVKIQLKVLDSPKLEAKTLIHEMKAYMDLQNTANFIIQMKEAVHPPTVLVPKNNGIIKKLFN